MIINILRYFLFGIAGDQEVDHTLVKFIIYSRAMNTVYMVIFFWLTTIAFF